MVWSEYSRFLSFFLSFFTGAQALNSVLTSEFTSALVDSGEKIALGITVLLAFSVFVLAIAEKMPETSDSMPLIGRYKYSACVRPSVRMYRTVVCDESDLPEKDWKGSRRLI